MTENPFADVHRDARGHLGLLFYEAVLGVVAYAGARAQAAGLEADRVLDDHPFLQAYLDQVSPRLPEPMPLDDTLAWLREQRAAWEEETDEWLPLRALTAELELDADQVTALVLAGVVEEDARFGDVFSAAQAPHAHRRPTLGLAHEVVRQVIPGAAGDGWTLCRPLLEAGLVEVLNPGDPRAEWQLRVPSALWTAVRGETPVEPVPGVRYHPPTAFEPLAGLVLADAERERLVELLALLATGDARTLVVRGMPGSERLEVVGAVARGVGRGVLEATPPADGGVGGDAWRLLGALATLSRAVPAFALELGPGETFELPAWRAYHGPAGVVLGHDGGLSGAAAERAITLHLAPEPPALRLRHWTRALPGAPAAAREGFARAYTLGGRYVRRAAGLARGYAALERRGQVDAADVRLAARAINRQQLDSLAMRLGDGGGWDTLVLHPSTGVELRHLERRCRHRERLIDTLSAGFPGGLNRGVRALFQGPSGTGKTLAARVVASQLGLDVYRVDLASIVNKYIGETEKNLSRVLGRAEDLDVVLLLDEGDSLMGKRTEVRSANDRWANLETNYLLQRLDTYTGIVIVTTNSPGSIDTAFQRRMDVVVSFHLPDAEERWQLWALHLPDSHQVPAAVVEDAAVRFDLTGGQIRNAAVHAALLSLSSRDGVLREGDLLAAVEAEYRKAGASYPRDRGRHGAARDESMAAFLGAIS